VIMLTGKWESSSKVGGCNFCYRHIREWGEIGHTVFVVQAEKGGLVARFCRRCAKSFRVKSRATEPKG